MPKTRTQGEAPQPRREKTFIDVPEKIMKTLLDNKTDIEEGISHLFEEEEPCFECGEAATHIYYHSGGESHRFYLCQKHTAIVLLNVIRWPMTVGCASCKTPLTPEIIIFKPIH